MVDDALLEDGGGPLAMREAVPNNEASLGPCICAEAIAGVILPVDGMSISVIVLLELSYG